MTDKAPCGCDLRHDVCSHHLTPLSPFFGTYHVKVLRELGMIHFAVRDDRTGELVCVTCRTQVRHSSFDPVGVSYERELWPCRTALLLKLHQAPLDIPSAT